MVGSIDEQREWARTSVLALTETDRCVLEVTGADRLSWLNGLLTCQLVGRHDGEAVYGLAVAQKGKIVSDVVVVLAGERAWLVVQKRTVETLVASFEHHLMMEDAELHRVDHVVWSAHGPKAQRLLEVATSAGGAGGALDMTGHGGALLVVPAGDASGQALTQAAVAAGGGEGDLAGWDAVRVPAGVPRFGVDFDDTTYPQEAGLEKRAVSFEKGCYLGQEVVCMLEMRGHVKRKLVSLSVPGTQVPAPHVSVSDDKGAIIGEVTSGLQLANAAEPEVRALAMIKYAFIAPGTVVSIEGKSATVL